MVKINGISMDVSGITIKEFLSSENYNMNRVAIECNGEIVPKSKYDEFVLKDGDCVEIVTFVGGG